jgi:hypothetical protein
MLLFLIDLDWDTEVSGYIYQCRAKVDTWKTGEATGASSSSRSRMLWPYDFGPARDTARLGCVGCETMEREHR